MGLAKFALVLASSGTRRNRKFQLFVSLQSRGFNGVFRTITNAQPQSQEDQTPHESLEARMSFVVQKLESVQKQKAEKGVALQKLRAWKDRNSALPATSNVQDSSVASRVEKTEEAEAEAEAEEAEVAGQRFKPREIILPSSASSGAEIIHPWPEWIELMERLVEHNYFDTRRSDEDDVIEKLSGGECGYKDEGVDIFKDLSTVRKACINFAKDRFDILRSLSRKDIQILAGYGCPNLDRKVVCSGKRLRAYVQLDEGDVCSSCKLRSSCETAYALPREEEPATTMDVIRILMVYGLDPLIGSAENKLHKRKTVKESIRKLLKEVVRLSAIPLDPNLPKPVVKKPAPKVKVPQPPPRKRVGRDDIEMKRGDWLCPKCDFMNFAKNHNCLQCDSKRPKRQLNPGEWECPGCNFLNYRRNMTCYNCDHKRPEDEYTSSLGHGRDGRWADDSQQSRFPDRRSERPFDLLTTSKAWNDDFDDDESDGAEVAVFENADSSRVSDMPLMNDDRGNRKDGCFDDDSFNFDDLPMHGNERRKDQNEITGWKIGHGNESRKDQNETPGWKTGHNGRGLEMGGRPLPPNSRLDAFNDFGDFDKDEDQDAGYSTFNGTSSNMAYKRDKIPSINSRINERGYNSDDDHLAGYQGKASQSFKRPLLSSPRGRSRKTDRFSNFDDDDDEDSFESDDDGTEWKTINKSRSVGSRGRGTRNRKGQRDSFGGHPYGSDDEVPDLSRTNQKRNQDAGFARRAPSYSSRERGTFKDDYDVEHEHSAKRNHGSFNARRGADGNSNIRGQGRLGPSYSSRGRGTFKDDYDDENEHSEKRNRGRANAHRRVGGNWNSRGQGRSGPSYSSRERETFKDDYDVENEYSAKRNQNSRGQGRSFRGSLHKSGRGSSFDSRERGRNRNSYDFEGDQGERGNFGGVNGRRGEGKRGNSRGRSESITGTVRSNQGAQFSSRGRGRMQNDYDLDD